MTPLLLIVSFFVFLAVIVEAKVKSRVGRVIMFFCAIVGILDLLFGILGLLG